MPPELTPFNLPDATTVTGKRDATTLPTQALYLLNNAFLVEQSKRLATRLLAATEDESALVTDAYRRALARKPTKSEVQSATEFLREAESALSETQPDGEARRHAATAAFCQALFASNEMRYVD
jgi:hypothetical protein